MRKLIDMAERLRHRHETPYDINLLQPVMLQEYSTTGHSLTAIRNLEKNPKLLLLCLTDTILLSNFD